MKKIQFRASNGALLELPARVVAHNRATYYSVKENTGHEGYDEEYDFTMSDDAELIDWAENNMGWADVSAFIEIVEQPQEPDYGMEWMNAELEVVDE